MSKKKAPFSMSKARMILKEKHPTLQGLPITNKQRGLLGVLAGGGKPRMLSS